MSKQYKSNSRGFSHHLLLPVIAILAVGTIGVMTLRLSDAATCKASTYRQGSKSTCVKYIQQIVNASGVTAKVSTDGVFGSGTKAAVVAFQKSKKLTADGIVGANTWTKLCAVTQSAAAAPKKSAGCGRSESSNAKTKTGWTKLGTTSQTDRQNGPTKVKVALSACKIAKSGRYAVKSRAQITYFGSNGDKANNFQGGSVITSVNDDVPRGNDILRAGTGTATAVSSKTFTSNTTVTVYGLAHYSGGRFWYTGGSGKATVKISNLLICSQ